MDRPTAMDLAPDHVPPARGADSSPRPFKCPYCDKAFHRLEHQTRHIRTHTGEKPHACSFPGCSKRFSRSDELTRHLRIHSNPNSRRANRHHAAVASVMMPPPSQPISRSAPTSMLSSPDVSPPSSWSADRPYLHDLSALRQSPTAAPGHADAAADAAARPEHRPILLPPLPPLAPRSAAGFASPVVAHIHGYPDPLLYPPGASRTPHVGPAPCASQPMSRSHSHDDDDQYAHRMTKKSRPGSPLSTAPPSPSLSFDSYSPTPEHTPLLTPSHSPHLRPHGHDSAIHLRYLSLHNNTPTVPHTDAAPHRTRVAVEDLLNSPKASTSAASSSTSANPLSAVLHS